MPSPFDEIDLVMQADVDHLFGEGIRVRPMAGDGNYAGGPDPERPVMEGVRATVARAAEAVATDYPGSHRNGGNVAVAPAEIWIDAAAYRAVGFSIRRGDLIDLTDDPVARTFVVAAVHEGDGGDVRITLG